MKIYKEGNTTLINGYCDEITTINKIPNDFDIIFTSPPYNIGLNGGFKKGHNTPVVKYRNDNDHNDFGHVWLANVIERYLDKCEYFFLNVAKYAGNKHQINELVHRLRKYYCDEIIIDKGRGMPNGVNKRVMVNVVEYVYIFSKKRPNNRAVGTNEWVGNVNNLFHLKPNHNNPFAEIHRAIMPVEWARQIIINFVKQQGKVLDIFGGLGTTAIAANQLGHECGMIEKDPLYCDKTIERIKNEFKNGKVGKDHNE